MEYLFKTHWGNRWTEETIRDGRLIKLVIVSPTREENEEIAKRLARRFNLDYEAQGR